MVARRLDRLAAAGERLPELLLIDGGAVQLAAAQKRIRERGMDQTVEVAAIAKARPASEDPVQRVDRVFRPGREAPLFLSEEPAAMRLLQRIRDEAHRFALAYQRRLRTPRLLGSELDAVPGVGKLRKRELLRILGSVAGVARASLEELLQVPGVDRKTATRIRRHFDEAREQGSEAAIPPAGAAPDAAPQARRSFSGR